MAKQVARKAPKAHYPAPYALVETWRRSGGGTQALLAAERKSVVKLAGTPTARNLTRVFFLQERLKGLGGKDSGIKHVHVVGAGVMGGDIRSEEHTSELQSLMRISCAVFCLKKQKT